MNSPSSIGPGTTDVLLVEAGIRVQTIQKADRGAGTHEADGPHV